LTSHGKNVIIERLRKNKCEVGGFMLTEEIAGRAHLIGLVAASLTDPKDRGPKVVEATLWDGRIVSATYYRGPKFRSPDAESRHEIFYDMGPIIPLVDKLLEDGESFVTVTGSHDTVCSLEWSIDSPAEV